MIEYLVFSLYLFVSGFVLYIIYLSIRTRIRDIQDGKEWRIIRFFNSSQKSVNYWQIIKPALGPLSVAAAAGIIFLFGASELLIVGFILAGLVRIIPLLIK